MVIGIGCDHAGFEYKQQLILFLQEAGYEVKDFGTHSTDSVDYPDYVHPLCNEIESANFTTGILLCGSANGVAITANKHQKIRAALCWRNDVAALVRQHNDANVLCLPARFISIDEAKQFIQTFLNKSFEGGRHQKRVNKISC